MPKEPDAEPEEETPPDDTGDEIITQPDKDKGNLIPPLDENDVIESTEKPLLKNPLFLGLLFVGNVVVIGGIVLVVAKFMLKKG